MVGSSVGRAALAWILLAAVLATGCASDRGFKAIPSATPVTAVLLSGRHSTVQLFDPRTGRAMTNIGLCSAAFDLTADARTRTFLTAQAGGVGPDSDDRMGVIDIGAGRIDYVRLPWPNPVQVAAVEGRAYVLHGVEGAQGLRLSVVDIARRTVCATGVVPAQTNDLFAAGDHVYVTCAREGGPEGTGELRRIDPRGPIAVHISDIDLLGGGFGAPGEGASVVLGGRRDGATPHAGRAGLEIHREGRESTTATVAVTGGIEQIATLGGTVALVDADSASDPQGKGQVVLTDLAGISTAKVPVRLPAAVSADGEMFAIADGGRGRIVWVRPNGSVRCASPLPSDAVGVCVAALP